MRWLVPLLVMLSCAHASPPAKPEPPAEKNPDPPPDDRRPCTTKTPELTLGPIPEAELNRISKDDFITLDLGACFGTCPEGPMNWTIEPNAARRLLAELTRDKVWALEPKMSVTVTDLPTARLEGQLGGRAVLVTHYGAGTHLDLGNRDFATASRLEQLTELISEAETRVVGCAPER